MARIVIVALATVAILAVTDWRVPMADAAALPWRATFAAAVIVAATWGARQHRRKGVTG